MVSENLFSQKVSAGLNTTANVTEEEVEEAQDKYSEAKSRHLNSHTYDNHASTILKVLLAIFIACLISCWFIFMRDILVDYFGHMHSKGQEVPKEVIIAVITMGTAVTGLMTHILKGLFSKSSENIKESKISLGS